MFGVVIDALSSTLDPNPDKTSEQKACEHSYSEGYERGSSGDAGDIEVTVREMAGLFSFGLGEKSYDSETQGIRDGIRDRGSANCSQGHGYSSGSYDSESGSSAGSNSERSDPDTIPGFFRFVLVSAAVLLFCFNFLPVLRSVFSIFSWLAQDFGPQWVFRGYIGLATIHVLLLYRLLAWMFTGRKGEWIPTWPLILIVVLLGLAGAFVVPPLPAEQRQSSQSQDDSAVLAAQPQQNRQSQEGWHHFGENVLGETVHKIPKAASSTGEWHHFQK